MKKWILKAVIQKTISLLPNKHRINYLFQRYITKGVRLSEVYVEDKLIHFQHHSRFWEEGNGDLKGKKVLELGTGWYPIVPVCFFLAGAERITTLDITPFLTPGKVRQALCELVRLQASGRLQSFVRIDPARWQIVEGLSKGSETDLKAILATMYIDYLVKDARNLPLEDHSVDFITSNNTFEHIYPGILEDILKEFKRVLKPGGMMSHFIDMSDHFAHLDPTITIYNFLRFSGRQWSRIDNSIQPQNRWRISHYRALYGKLGIPVWKEENRPGDVIALRTVPVHPEYSEIPETVLAVSHSYMVTK